MSRSLTAQDRSSLIRLASSLPSGSPERKTILARVAAQHIAAMNGPDVIASVMLDGADSYHYGLLTRLESDSSGMALVEEPRRLALTYSVGNAQETPAGYSAIAYFEIAGVLPYNALNLRQEIEAKTVQLTRYLTQYSAKFRAYKTRCTLVPNSVKPMRMETRTSFSFEIEIDVPL